MAWVNCQAPFQNYELLQLTASGLAKIGNQYAVWDDNDFDLTTGTASSLEVYPTEPWSLAVHDGVIGYQVDHDSATTYWLNYLYPVPTPYFYVKKDQLSESFKFVMCVNTETETALLGIKFNNGLFNSLVDAVFYDDALNYLNPPITYQWQSVPSISGKNGILVAMSTISDMNDGEPVTTTDTTKFTLVEESNVGVITEDIDDSIKPGADAGGISGNGENSAEQLYGYAFGQGETASGVSGGGGGLYGGFAGNLVE